MSAVIKGALLLGLGLALTFTAVPAAFSTDENQYTSFAIAISKGKLHVPGTEDLPPTRGLAYFGPFDPTPRPVPPHLENPVRFGVSPLHAILAAPFVPLGWFALVALNAFSFCVALALIFHFSRRWSQSDTAPWIACLAFGVGSFSFEYAQGVWPHMLSLAAVLGSFSLAALFRESNRLSYAFLSGLLAAAAYGFRTQSILFIPLLGLGIFLLSRRRWSGSASFIVGLLPLMLLYSTLNFVTRGSWLPFTRSVSYFKAGGGNHGYPLLVEWALVLWAKIVDFSTHPAVSAIKHSYMLKDPITGATMIEGAIKKAWLQSSPWVAISLIGSLVAWRWAGSNQRTRELRAISILLFGSIAALSLKGFSFVDGLAFNQRYLIDLTPFAAIALALTLDRFNLLNARLGIALAASAAVFLGGWLLLPSYLVRVLAMKVPLALAAGALVGWWLSRNKMKAALPLVLGACIGWGAIAHVVDDLAASRRVRSRNLAQMNALAPLLTDGTALFAFWGRKDPYGPLQFHRDLLIIDSSPDDSAALQRLTHALLAQGRKVLLIPEMPAEKLHAMADGLHVTHRGFFPVSNSTWSIPVLELSYYEPDAPHQREQASAASP